MKDDLTSLLDKIAECDVLLLGSPIYFGNVTGEMRSFLERLLFSAMTYNIGHASVFRGKVSSGFIYTMNVPEDISAMNIPDEYKKHLNYEPVYQYFKFCLQRLNGPSEFMLSQDTSQFHDYSQYEASMFDEKHKAKIKAERFPLDCQNAFDMGVRLASK